MDPAPASPDPSPQQQQQQQQDHLFPAPNAKRSAWKHPSSNGFFPDAPPPGVMDADHWPALADAAKTKTSPPSADSPKPHPPDSSPAPPAAAVASSAVANPSNSPKHTSGPHHARQKPARRGGGGGGSGGGGGGGDHSPRDHHDRGTGGWDHGGGGRGGQRNHNNGGGGRRGGANTGSAGGVAHHGGFGGRRRGGFEGFYRGPSMGIGPYMRGAPPPPPPLAVAPPFMGPPPPPVSHMRAFAGPMLFHEMPSPVSPVSPMYYVGPPPPPEALRGLAFAPPMVGPPAYPYFQPPADPDADAEDQAKLLKQIEFYFSKDNLCTDVFLRRNMDEEGWVDISLIAGFNKVQAITANLQYIKETIQSSSILEIQGDKIRRQNDWDKWVIPRESNPDIASSSAAVPSPNVNDLTAHLGGVALHETAGSSSSTVDQNHHEVLLNGSTSSNNQAPVVEDNAGDR